MTYSDYLRGQARECIRLADNASGDETDRLLELAESYRSWATDFEGLEGEASRTRH